MNTGDVAGGAAPAESLTAEQLIEKMEVPGFPGVFVLGSFARRVTVYSQQVRALNLIDSLVRAGKLSARTKLAVVGGGAAGLTAAAGAAARGVPVTLFEKNADSLPVQSTNRQRYLHPHIYDWPDMEYETEDAQLPVLNWTADITDKVVEQLRARWRTVKGVKTNWGAANIRLHVEAGGGVTLTWDSDGSKRESFEAVILAVGFGVESDTGVQHSYWKDDDIDHFHDDPRHWLVSGYGDGGLTDLMRLCIREFNHKEVVMKFARAAGLEDLRRELMEVERDPSRGGDRKALTEFYEALEVESICEVLRPMLRDNVVSLNGDTPYPYGPESSVLNRLIVSQLFKLGAFKLIPSRVKVEEIKLLGAGKGYEVPFEGGPPLPFAKVILRHGPRPSALEKSFPEVWRACEAQRKAWRELPPERDTTRRRMWEPDAFGPGDEVDFGDKVGCLIIVPDATAAGPLRRYTDNALHRLEDYFKHASDRPAELTPRVKKLSEVFAGSLQYDGVVRALCRTDIVIFDLTGYDPGMMLLLGIRSAVRRGVTIATIDERLSGHKWAALPFNLKELNPIPYGGGAGAGERLPAEVIGEMIQKGLALLNSLPHHYLDLPAFDAVRQLGPNQENYRPLTLSEQILVLCSFDPDYQRENWSLLKDELMTAFGVTQQTLRRIIDIASPRLVSHRLYAEIRRSDACLVDWTGWRANVFYELGVRLAVNEIGPICVLHQDEPIPEDKQAQYELLRRFFSPIPYSMAPDADLEPFRAALRERYAEVSSPHRAARASGAFAHDHTFRVIFSEVALRQEPGGARVHQELRELVTSMIGIDPIKSELPVLFSKNKELSAQVREGAVERLWAAWHYLRGRHRPWRLPPDDRLRQEYISVGSLLSTLLQRWGNERERVLGARIGATVRRLRRAGKEADGRKEEAKDD